MHLDPAEVRQEMGGTNGVQGKDGTLQPVATDRPLAERSDQSAQEGTTATERSVRDTPQGMNLVGASMNRDSGALSPAVPHAFLNELSPKMSPQLRSLEGETRLRGHMTRTLDAAP